ncbi:hypothetical protein ONE63_002538 [Megalurothrips usitatus]|uniref:Mitochondrial assembly of ribosomal large subunit protein 1 n=1 Tax=Megalurothrips usitatus TaxID=439358 RepID=A0AAV7XAS6_9NEOP|nr:hypothetical protein ONE63_002538 [Megalurothrips usitatus]
MFMTSKLSRIVGDSGRACSFIRSVYEARKLGISENKLRRSPCFVARCYSSGEDNQNKNVSHNTELCKENDDNTSEVFDLEKERDKIKSGDLSKYKVFKDEDSPIILDVEEERLLSQTGTSTSVPQRSEFEGISFERGLHGVFDTEELVSILKDQKADNIVVIHMPQDLGYADHMIIISGRSSRHLLAMATYVRRVFKKKMHKNDKIPIIEGQRNKSEDWLALDLGNIVLHLFSKKTRELYDLESLWAVGPEFDPHLNKDEDPLSDFMSKHSLSLGDLQPADSK